MKKTLTVIRPGRYGTRMLKAGDPLEDISGPDARLYRALGWAAEVERPERVVPTTRQVLNAEAVETPKPKTSKAQLDHDKDGKAGGSAKGAMSTRSKGAAKKRKK